MGSMLATDGKNVYWGGSSKIMKVPLDGTAPSTLVPTGAAGIAVDTAFIYWTYFTKGGDGVVMRVPLDGGAQDTLASGQSRPSAVAVNASNVYWTNYNAVMKLAFAGDKPIKLADTDPNGGPFVVTLDTSNLYYAAESTGTVVRVPLDGSPAVTLAKGEQVVSGLVVAGSNVYWPTATGVIAVPVGGGATSVFASPVSPKGSSQAPRGIAAYGGVVYWIDQPSPLL